MNKLIIILLSVFTLTNCQCNIKRAKPFLKRSVHEFNLELVKRIAEETDNHFVASGLSTWALLATISLGATEMTIEELQHVLRLHPHPCFNRKFFKIIEELTAPKDGVTIERSANILADINLNLKKVFKRKVKKSNITQIHEGDFVNPENISATINNYVSQTTRGAIEELVTPSDLEGVDIVLADALYFKGTWKHSFSEADTEESAFYNENGEQIGDVNLMFGAFEANVINFEQIESKVLELPYDDRYVMLIILPNPGVPVGKVLDKLKSYSISSFFLQFKGPVNTTIQIPKFEILSDLNNMKELLMDMGMKYTFHGYAAYFDDLTSKPVQISNVIQKAKIEVTEEGTEASAATAGMFMSRAATIYEQEFLANRPFIFMIVDKNTEIALFTGAFSKPQPKV